MQYLLIENKGELDVNSLILMGGSTKTGDKTKLGQWGSGNKYFIAMLLRRGIDFKIFSGEKEIKITTQKADFRDQSFKQILIDGKETSLTTNMGHDWIPYFAVREAVQNAYDEGGVNIVPNIETPQGKTGKTRFYFEQISEIQEVIDNWDDYFTFDRDDILHENKYAKIFPNKSDNLVLFHKGIKCSEYKNVKSLYNYCSDFTINESRVIKHEHEVKTKIGNALATCTDSKIIFDYLCSDRDNYEHSVWYLWASAPMSPTWKEVLKDRKIILSELAGWYIEIQEKYSCFILKNDLCKYIKKNFPDIYIYGMSDDGEQECLKKEVEIDKKKEFLLGEVKKFFTEINYTVEYPIKVVQFEQADKLGLAENKTIYISEKCFDMGKREIAITIMEENEHLITGYKDCSRALQQHLFNKWISTLEEKHAYFL